MTNQILISDSGADGSQVVGEATPPPSPPLSEDNPALQAIRRATLVGKGFGSETTNVMAVGLATTLAQDAAAQREEVRAYREEVTQLSSENTLLKVAVARMEASVSANSTGIFLAKVCLSISALLTPLALEVYRGPSPRTGVVLGIVAIALIVAGLLPTAWIERIIRRGV